MKKFLLILLVSLLSYTNIIAQTVQQQGWKVENKQEWGSFYWCVTRSMYADNNGKYWYYIYASSNSLFKTKSDGRNYDKAITYVKNVKIYMYVYKYYNGYKRYVDKTIVNLSHFTCDYQVNNDYYIAYFWSDSPYNTFNITFDKASAYDNSDY